MNLILKCMVIDLGILEEAMVSQSEKHIFNKPLNPKLFWVFFFASGAGRLTPIEGMMNSDTYKDILTKYLMPSLSNSSSPEGPIFQPDLALATFTENAEFFKAVRNNCVGLPWKLFRP